MIRTTRSRQTGFSLLEILIVVALIAFIGTMVARNVFGGSDRARARLAETQLTMLAGKIEQYELDVGALPQSLEDLVRQPGGSTSWLGPYAKADELKDPWQRPIEYRVPGAEGRFDLISLGSDGQPGGEGVNRDITQGQ
jgi:general secretion pathway protein G